MLRIDIDVPFISPALPGIEVSPEILVDWAEGCRSMKEIEAVFTTIVLTQLQKLNNFSRVRFCSIDRVEE